MSIRVLINGAAGKMGRTTVDAIAREKELRLVATASRSDDLSKIIHASKADVVIDFTVPQCVFENTKKIIAANARPVIGTSGLTQEHIAQLSQLCQEKKMGGIVAPNFSIGAILMMRFAKEAAQYFNDAEIVEWHHAQKIDAPSATAKKTAELISENKKIKNTASRVTASARGEMHCDIPIHSIRMPGVFANQSVIFGNSGETLTVHHQASDRAAMMPGVFLCCRKVMTLDRMVYGMETLV
ncbi:MAG: dihydrodipicolinate reductase [uncultured bacterium]|nr:MAG: dihydrodipicolinate reductase [uncultured bacterium]OGT27080.1 MAG: 4-hydroxy-tetrahydrodipicolinate reductase [Gammaproteobacteria bacterium RIFCSPHIGHO2_02_FULL_42_43]OGT53529.1 MAG: 4-hydroxy-tetrahydrodipicolinate reductase [Gammaproteobacteria bacterium RIFCSPHIGHO2_12_FULL_41_25]OGT61473.1 MAG: 4-hydroxy-tetrahydrodipicolinate reductase [Gammaproteobacteria bacterium RIFCSPLOWO2_02_FULL_42_14]OGT86759.1 MAG: 4-hydroxy-tetrahydrodipicolinate reductase [Gammaproteobacteria bacterium